METTIITATLPNLSHDIIVYMAQFMTTSSEFLRYVIIACMEKDKFGKVTLSNQLKTLSLEWKKKVEYQRRSEIKHRFFSRIYLDEHLGVKIEHTLEMIHEENGSRVQYLDVEKSNELHAGFAPLLPFLGQNCNLVYTKDENSHLNGRFHIELNKMLILGKFKDSKIEENVYMRRFTGKILFILPLDDTSLHGLSNKKIVLKLKRLVGKSEEEMEILREHIHKLRVC